MTRHRHAARKLLRTLFTGQLDLEGDLAVDEVESVLCSVSRAAEEAARAEEREAIRLLLDTVDELLGDGLGRDPDFVDGAKVNAVENALAAIRARGQAAAGPCESPVNEEDVDGVQYCGRCRFASVAHRRGQP